MINHKNDNNLPEKEIVVNVNKFYEEVLEKLPYKHGLCGCAEYQFALEDALKVVREVLLSK